MFGGAYDISISDDWINPRLVLSDEETDLIGVGSSAGSIMAFVSDALRKAGNKSPVINAWRMEAMSSDYDHLLTAATAYLGY